MKVNNNNNNNYNNNNNDDDDNNNNNNNNYNNNNKQLQKQTQYYVLLAMLLLRWWVEIKKVRKLIGKMPNWKSPGPDGVQGSWIKDLSNLHNCIALQLDRCLQENNLPKWMVTGKTLLCIKEI